MPARLTAGIREQGARRSCGDLGGPTPSRVRNWLRKAEVSVVQGPKTAAEGTTRRVRTRLPGRKRRFSKSPSWDLEQQRLDRRDNCRVQERIPRGKRAPWAPRSSRMKRTTAEVQGPRGPSWPQSVGWAFCATPRKPGPSLSRRILLLEEGFFSFLFVSFFFLSFFALSFFEKYLSTNLVRRGQDGKNH